MNEQHQPSTLKDITLLIALLAGLILLLPPLGRLMNLYADWWWKL